jgi:hypothetical protein
LEAPVKGFFQNLADFSHRIQFVVLHGCEIRPLEYHFPSRAQPKVTWGEIQRVQWLGDDRSFSRQTIAAQQAMCGSVHYHDADTSVPATSHVTSSELHYATSAKLARRNDQ